MKERIIIGLGYRARSGKDTVGDYLVAKYGFRRIAFADMLKTICGVLCNDDAREVSFKTNTTPFGLTGGQMLQRVGVSLRDVLGPDVWIHASQLDGFAMRRNAKIVVTDCRFANEATFVKKLGGTLIEVFRPGLPNDLHVSEVAGQSIKWDRRLMNTGTIAELHQQVDQFLSDL